MVNIKIRPCWYILKEGNNEESVEENTFRVWSQKKAREGMSEITRKKKCFFKANRIVG